MGGFKFIHCADLHLGARFKGIETDDSAEMLRMRKAPAESFRRIVDLAVSEKASFMVISGDLFEKSAQPSDRRFFCAEAARAGIPIFISKGNHDTERPWDSAMPFPRNVRVFGTEAESAVLEIGGAEAEIVGISFAGRHESRNLVSMLSGNPEMFTVACVHCYVEEVGEGHPDAVCRMSDFLGRNIDYWALGHIHRRLILREFPHAVYPGNIQGRNRKEIGPKGAYIISVADGKIKKTVFAETQSIQWRSLRADVTGLSEEELMSALSDASVPGDILSISFRGTGVTAGRIASDPESFSSRLAGSLGARILAMDCSRCVKPAEDGIQKSIDETVEEMASGNRLALEEAIYSTGLLEGRRDIVASLSDRELLEAAEDAAAYLAREAGMTE